MDSKIRVLLVEDDLDQAELVENSLQGFDSRFEVETIHTGDACLKKLSDNDYEVIILDYKLPVLNGLEILNQFTKQGIDTPVVVVSGQGNEQIAVDALKNGAYDYIVKDASYLSVLPKVVQKTIEKYHLERKLRESERKYHNIFEKANDAIFIINPLNFILVEVNIKATEMTRFNKEELFTKQFMDLYPEDQKTNAKHVIHKTLAEGSYRDDNLTIFTKDGHLVPVDINASVIHIGQYKYILGIIRNITEKKHLQSLILNSKKRLQATFDGITDIIYQVNRDFEIIMANKKFAEICGTQPEKLIGKKCYESFYNCKTICDECPARVTFETREPKYLEKTVNDQIYENWSYPIFSESGEIESVAIYCKNVTEKKILEKTLIQSEKLATIGLLSSGIAHELRNPLNIIETARYYIQEFSNELKPDAKGKLDIIGRNVQRASKIINNLLEFSRQSEHEREQINLNKLIESTIALIGKELTAKKVEFFFESSGDYCTYFSVDSLKQVLLNIIINAIQAMPNGGKLAIEIGQANEKWIDIKITDTGTGIPEEILPHIFSPFFTTKEVGVGTGLGLYIAHIMIRRDGGEIKVKSKVGRGTTFTISLPAKNCQCIEHG
jgi:PAS domain S-box-containing protein